VVTYRDERSAAWQRKIAPNAEYLPIVLRLFNYGRSVHNDWFCGRAVMMARGRTLRWAGSWGHTCSVAPFNLPVAESWFAARQVTEGITLISEPHVNHLIRANFYHIHGARG